MMNARWTRLVALVSLVTLLVGLLPSVTHAASSAEDEVAQAAQSGGVTIKGTFRYKDSGQVMRPIAFAKVEIWSFRSRSWFNPFWTWDKDTTVTTSSDGSIQVSMPFHTRGVLYSVRVFATNYAAVVWPNDVVHTLPFHREPGEPGPARQLRVEVRGQVLKFSYDFADDWAPQHYNLAETVRRGFDYATQRRDPRERDIIPPVKVQPTSASPTGTWYNPAVDTLVIDSSHVFEDYLILHEYAHFLEEQISSFHWSATDHNGCIARDALGKIVNDAEHAWMEGFANYFAQAVALTRPHDELAGTPRVGTLTMATLETPYCSSLPEGVSNDAVEKFVAGELWDLVDQPGDPAYQNEPSDITARQDLLVFQIFDRELDTYGKAPTIQNFRAAWATRIRPRPTPGLPLDNIPPICHWRPDLPQCR